MGRTREFDYTEAVAKATKVFWEKGYSNTSLRDLLDAMGIGQGSFYTLVKSKRELYLECLKQYNQTVTRRRWDALTKDASIKRGIRAFFKAILDELDDPRTPNVCLMAGSLASDVLSEPSLSKYVIEEMKSLEAAIAKRIDEAKQSGELPKTFDSKLVASIVITYLQGFFRVIGVLKNRRQMEAQIEQLLTGVGL